MADRPVGDEPPPPGDLPAAGAPAGDPTPAGPTLPPLPERVIAAAYVLALLTLLVPFAVLGALFAGVVLIRRGRPGAGAGVIAVGAACVVLGLTVVWT